MAAACSGVVSPGLRAMGTFVRDRPGLCLLELLRERGPGLRVAAADVARDHDAVLVEDGDRGMPEQSERPGELCVRVDERGPSPPVLAQESLCPVRVVQDVQANVLVLRVTLDEPCVGDRLAIADRSPGRPDVDEDRLPVQVGEREPLAVEGLALELDARLRGLADGRGRAPTATLVGAPASAAGGERPQRDQDERESHHASR
jgi:hypothetical protein